MSDLYAMVNNLKDQVSIRKPPGPTQGNPGAVALDALAKGEVFVAVRRFKAAGVSYLEGEPFDASSVNTNRIAQLAEYGFIVSAKEYDTGGEHFRLAKIWRDQVQPQYNRVQSFDTQRGRLAAELADAQAQVMHIQAEMRDLDGRRAGAEAELLELLEGAEIPE